MLNPEKQTIMMIPLGWPLGEMGRSKAKSTNSQFEDK